MSLKKIFLILFFSINFVGLFSNVLSDEIEKCNWDNRNGIPCITVQKTPNTSQFSEGSINKLTINRQEIERIGAVDVVDILNYIDGIDL